MLILVLGLRRGELLGLTWPMVDLETAQLEVGYSLQRIGGRLVHGETKTEASDAVLPLPAICLAALRLHHQAQAAVKDAAGPFWIPTGHVFTTRDGLPLDPATSTGPSRHGPPRPGYVPSPSMGPAIPAGRCWAPWTSTPASPCRSCDTARSP